MLAWLISEVGAWSSRWGQAGAAPPLAAEPHRALRAVSFFAGLTGPRTHYGSSQFGQWREYALRSPALRPLTRMGWSPSLPQRSRRGPGWPVSKVGTGPGAASRAVEQWAITPNVAGPSHRLQAGWADTLAWAVATLPHLALPGDLVPLTGPGMLAQPEQPSTGPSWPGP